MTITSRPINVTEFARRLCVRNHPHLNTTGAVVPCGIHLREGNMYHLLVTDEGRHTFEVIRDAREEFLWGDTEPDRDSR